MKISVVIPTYNRELHLKNCLRALLSQQKLPYEVLVIDNANHSRAKAIVVNIKKNFTKNGIKISYLRNEENSGATARNLGALSASGDLIAFLDDDVKLDSNYYYEIEKVFLNNPGALGAQGWDPTLKNSLIRTKQSLKYKILYEFDKFFSVSSFFEQNQSRVLPSLCVTSPYPDNFNSLIQSQWISTCAGVFSNKVFSRFRFDSQLKKYSWNEYIDFSYGIFLKHPQSLFLIPNATYFDVQTNDGRLELKELIYMAEVYDLYIFFKRFKISFKNIFLYVFSKLGRMVYNIVRILIKTPKEFHKIFYILHAPIYVLLNINKIKIGNLDFFNKTLS